MWERTCFRFYITHLVHIISPCEGLFSSISETIAAGAITLLLTPWSEI